MLDLVKELEGRKDRELRARIEKEEISKALKEIERTKISALEQDKRRELERLAADREGLRLKEEEVMDEIKNLEHKLYEQERMQRERRDPTGDQIAKSQYYGNEMRKKEIEIAKQRGEDLAQLKHRKELLEKERVRILDDLDRVKNGDITALRRNEASRWVGNDIIANPSRDFNKMKLDPALKDKLVTDQVRIKKLKEERDRMTREYYPEIDEIDILAKELETEKYYKKAGELTDRVGERDGVNPRVLAD